MGASVRSSKQVQVCSEKSKQVHYPSYFSSPGCFCNAVCFYCIICLVAGLYTNTWSAPQKSTGTLPFTLRGEDPAQNLPICNTRSSCQCICLQTSGIIIESLTSLCCLVTAWRLWGLWRHTITHGLWLMASSALFSIPVLHKKRWQHFFHLKLSSYLNWLGKRCKAGAQLMLWVPCQLFAMGIHLIAWHLKFVALSTD